MFKKQKPEPPKMTVPVVDHNGEPVIFGVSRPAIHVTTNAANGARLRRELTSCAGGLAAIRSRKGATE